MVVDEVNGVMRVIDTVFYPVRKASKVKLSDVVGDFQAGGTSYTWQGQPAVGNPNFEDELINKQGEAIANTVLHCVTKVMDINPNSNRTSVTFTLKGGVAPQSFPYAVQVKNEHGTALYQISFVFVEQA